MRRCVLVVDDDPTIRQTHERALERAGWAVETASDGEMAAARVGAEFDCVVSDLQMPGMDGLQLLRRVRERDLDLPVVLVTGSPSLDSAMRAVEYGAFRYLTKPVSPADLVKTVTEAARMGALARIKREAFAATDEKTSLIGDRAGLEASFSRALDTLWMAFQPIVMASDRRIYAHEALMRSVEPSLPHPGAMLDAAERLDSIHALGRTIRARVAGEIPAADPDVAFFVNLHPRDLLDDRLLDGPLVDAASRVVLEITERASLHDLTDLRARVAKLRAVGFRLAIDDLGAGYAGLTTFATIEPEIVKIDMSLVRDIDRSDVKRKVVGGMAALCHELGALVVAEGIETVAERDTVIELGCDLLQGYVLARPGRPFPTITW